MKLKGISHLSKNDYDSIIFRNGRINVYGKSTWPSLKLSYSIEDDLKRLDSDEEKERRIVEYFLDYSTVNAISENYSHAGTDYLLIGSTVGKMLKFGHQPSQDIINMILAKYKRDRIDYFFSDEAECYDIASGYSTTSYYKDIAGKVTINICNKNGNVLFFEKEFLQEFLPRLFGENEVSLKYCEAKFSEDNQQQASCGYYVFGTDKTIKVGVDLVHLISTIIWNHNIRVGENKKQNEIYKQLQLKMEGF